MRISLDLRKKKNSMRGEAHVLLLLLFLICIKIIVKK